MFSNCVSPSSPVNPDFQTNSRLTTIRALVSSPTFIRRFFTANLIKSENSKEWHQYYVDIRWQWSQNGSLRNSPIVPISETAQWGIQQQPTTQLVPPELLELIRNSSAQTNGLHSTIQVGGLWQQGPPLPRCTRLKIRWFDHDHMLS